METKFVQFLKANAIDSRRLLVASSRLERLERTDRALMLAKRLARKEGASDAIKEQAKGKRAHSGRPVTPRLIQSASVGKPLTGRAKTRLLRAVNHVLSQKKKDAVDLRAIF
jgi:hypothetical protein